MAPIPPTNPYAAPDTLPAAGGTTLVPRWCGRAVFVGSFWWLFVGVAFAGFSQSHGGEHPDFAASVGVCALFLAWIGWMIHGLGAVVWQVWAWMSIRPEFRKNGSAVSVILLFVPFFSLVWIFVLTRRLEAAIAEQGRDVRGGMRACVLSLVATFVPVLLPVAAYAWLRFTDDVSAALAEAHTPHEPVRLREDAHRPPVAVDAEAVAISDRT